MDKIKGITTDSIRFRLEDAGWVVERESESCYVMVLGDRTINIRKAEGYLHVHMIDQICKLAKIKL